MSVLVQGILRYPDNSPIVGASIKFIASKFISSGVPIGASLEIVTDSIGAYSQEVLEGSYHVFYKQSGKLLYTHIIDTHLFVGMGSVALGDPITLEEIVGVAIGSDPVYAGCVTVPAPTAFTVASGFTTIILSWEGTNYACHEVAEIWVSATAVFSSRVLLDTTEANVYSHSIGDDGIRYYWLRFRNLNKDTGNWFSTTAVTGRTAQDPGKVLANLQADIYASALFAALRNSYSSTFAQDTAPTTRANGDALLSGDEWIDTNDYNQRYIWDTTLVPPAWEIKVSKEVTAILTDVSHVQTVASDGSRGYFQPTQPLATQSRFNDIWIDTSQATPLTTTAIYRYENASSGSTGTLSWRSAPSNAVGKSYVEAYNTKAIVGGHSVELQEAFTTTNALEGQYSLRINANGNIAGFGLSAGSAGCLVSGVLDISIAEVDCTGTDEVWVPAESSFIVAANTFAITGTDETPVTPFVVRVGDADGTCYVDGTINAAATQVLCEAITGGSWSPPNTSVVGIQGSLVLDGTMNANAIVSGSITGDLISGTTITGTHIEGATIKGTHIEAGSISAAHIDTAGLTANEITLSPSDVGVGTDSGSNRMEIDASSIKVYSGGVLRVKLGNLG